MTTSTTLTALRALIRKDLILYFSNRRALVMSIAAPIVIAAFFGSLFGSGGERPSKVPIAFADLDGSPISQALAAALGSDTSFELRQLAEPAAIDAARRGKVRAAIVVPAGFGAKAPAALLGGGEKPTLAVHYDPSQATALPLVRGLLSQHVVKAIGESLGGPPGGGGARAGGFSLPYETQTFATTASADRPYNGYAHSFAGMGVQFILFMGIEVGVGVLLARRLGLWKRLRAAPLSRTVLLGSHILSGGLTALILLVIIYAAAMTFFNVRIEGSLPGFIGIAIAFALLTSSFGLLIAAIGKTPEATRGLAIFATLVMVMLGGAWVPSFIFPEWLQTASLIVPTRWAVDGLDAMTWRGLGFSAAIAPIGALLFFSGLFAAIAIWRFDWEEPRG
ncbi:MAG: ABC transporter permease [Caldimonas sp.]